MQTTLTINGCEVQITTSYDSIKYGGVYFEDKSRARTDIEIRKDGKVVARDMSRCRPETCEQIRAVVRKHEDAMGIVHADVAALDAVDASRARIEAAMTLNGRSE